MDQPAAGNGGPAVSEPNAAGGRGEAGGGHGVPEWAVHLPPGRPPAGVDLLVEGSLPASWAKRWASDPGRVALLDDKGASLTGAELEETTSRLAGRLRRAGLEPGDRILTSVTNSLDLALAHVSALRAGLIVVPANTSYTERELRHILEETSPSAAVVDSEARARWLRDWRNGSLLVTGPGLDLPEGPPPPLDEAGPDDPALISFTSGTTGAPKGAVLTHANVLATAESLRLAWRWSPEDRLVLSLPMFHGHGLAVGLHGTLNSGASAVILPRFDAPAVLDALSVTSATLFFGVPTMYTRLADSGRASELSGLRLCVSGSAPLPVPLHKTLSRLSGQAVLERYGMTETLMTVSNPYDGERRAGRVGFALPGVEVRVDSRDRPGGEGEILVRGPNVFPGYWRREEESRRSFEPGGWFHTGDLARRDADGYLEIVGRSRDLIITGGYNVYPVEVENVLLGHPAVREVAVVGLPSEEWGEEVAAFVVTSDRLESSELLSFAARYLAPFKRPRSVRFVDELPRNPLGKVLKQQLSR